MNTTMTELLMLSMNPHVRLIFVQSIGITVFVYDLGQAPIQLDLETEV